MLRTQLSLLCCVLLLLAYFSESNAEAKYRTPARILAKQTGATQFEEERYESHTNCNEHKHHLKKRASDEDVDYEVYQGVVGRPGIDFPIYPRIPKTQFSCRSYGNGYFADMETDCQVFHICEEGRKISFLCPNGTIFQQSELTCDWWFKVNCLGSSGYYAESAEILNKQRVHRVRPSVPVQGFNIVGGGLNIKPKVTPAVGQSRSGSRNSNKSDRRIDSTEDLHTSLESVDFEDVSGEKQRKVLPTIENNSNDHETQITAESSSFVTGTGKRRNGQDSNGNNNNNINKSNSPNSNDDASVLKPARNRVSSSSQERSSQLRGTTPGHTESRERLRNGQRGQQRYRELDSEEQHHKEKSKEKSTQISTSPKQDKPEFYEAHSTRTVQHTTPYYMPSSYSTARRLEPSKATPYYTPTVPSVSKSKSTEGKVSYIKGGYTATTPNPNRFGSPALSGIFIESSVAPASSKPTVSSSLEIDSTFKPFIIGMRHHYDVGNSGEQKHPSLNINFKVEQPPKKSIDYLPTTPAPTAASSRPTYLPKSQSPPKSNAATAGGESLLFAPNPVKEESVYRNVQDMLKTVNLLNDKFDSVELSGQSATPARAGLEIPPSSGPDALVSLAKYFAQEHNDTNNALGNSLGKPEKQGASTKLSAKPSAPIIPTPKPSDTTVSATTPETPIGISDKADDIKQSLLSAKTVQKYSNLFGLQSAKGRAQTEGQSDVNAILPGDKLNETTTGSTYQQFPQIGSTGSTIGTLSAKPESRKIAQIFSNALSSYLDNPNSFRAELASRARPTEPPNFKPVTTTDASLFNDGTAKYYLPTKPSPDLTTPQNIAVEINHKFDSTPAPEYSTTTELYELSTSRDQDSNLELSAELSPPSADSGEGEFLQQQQTQSFVKSRNDLLKDSRPQKLITTHKPTENPWSLKSQTDFLDPLTINDALMKEQRTTTTTAAPFTYLPRLVSSTTTTSTHSTPTQARYEWEDIFRSYDIPRDALPSSSGLQRIANKLFGGLNEQEALHLRNVMAKAEHDRQVLSLLLLLIQTCDDHNGKALERSRKHLLNALIDIDSKLPSKSSSRQKLVLGSATPTTTLRVPVTTFRRNSNSDYYSSTTPGYTTTTELPLPTSTTAPSYEETTKFEIHVEEIEDTELTATTSAAPTHLEDHSDRRALELLKSLYSLASKFSSSRR